MGTPDAIQDAAIVDDDATKDVSLEEVVDQRQIDFDAIADKVDAERIDEMAIEPIPDDKLEKDEKAGTDEAAAPEKDPPAKDDDVEMVEVVIDGKKSMVSMKEIVDAGRRTYQKETAADQRLAESKTLLQEVKEIRASLETPSKGIQPDQDAGGDDQSNEDLLHAIRYGEDDVALAAIETLKGRSQRVKPDEIGRIVDDRIKAQSTKTIQERFSMSPEEGGFSDLLEKEALFNYTSARVNELVAAGEGAIDDYETYRTAGNWVRETILGKAKVDSPNPEDLIEGKKLLKQQKDTITPASATADSTDEDTAEPDLAKSRKDTIAQMKKERESGRG